MTALVQHPRRALIFWALMAGALVFLVLMKAPTDDMSDKGVGVIEYELARTSEKASEYYGALGDEGRDAAEKQLYLDYPYLILYGLAYAAAALIVGSRAAERGKARLASWGRPVAVAALIGAAADAVENFGLLRVTAGHTDQPWPGIAFSFASLKFLLLTIVGIYVLVGLCLTLSKTSSAPSR